MNRLVISLCLVVMLPIPITLAESSGSGTKGQVSSEDQSERRKPPHKKKKVVRRRYVEAYRPARPAHYRSRVIVRRSPVVVHRTSPVYSHTTVYRDEPSDSGYSSEPEIGLGFRVSGVAVEGQKLNLDTMENATMGGVGFQVRGLLNDNVGLELSVDILGSQNDTLQQTTVPLMLSVLYYIIPDGAIRPYGLIGTGLQFSALEYENGFRYDFVEFAAQAGGGVEVRLADNFGLHADVRFLGIFTNLDPEANIYSECSATLGYNDPFCNKISADDGLNLGIQFMAGASIYF